MITPILCAVCDGILLDPRTQQMTLVSLYDSYIPVEYPARITPTFVVSFLRDLADPVSYDGRIEARLDGEIVFSDDLRVAFAGARIARSARFNFPLEVARPCEAQFSFVQTGTVVCTYQFSFLPVPVQKTTTKPSSKHALH